MQKYNKTNIIVLALLYNYISNKEKTLKTKYIENFFNELNYELLLMGEEIVSEEEDLEQNIYQYSKTGNEIQIWNPERLPYSLVDMKRLYVDLLPSAIIDASLAPNVLINLKINRDKINTRTCLEPQYVLAKNPEFPSRKTNIKKLRKPTVESQSEYKVSYVYSIEKQIIDIDDVIDKHEKKLKFN